MCTRRLDQATSTPCFRCAAPTPAWTIKSRYISTPELSILVLDTQLQVSTDIDLHITFCSMVWPGTGAKTESPSPRPTSPITNQLPVTPSSYSPPTDTHSTPMPPAPNELGISIGRPLRTHKPPSYLNDYYVSIARSNSYSSTKQVYINIVHVNEKYTHPINQYHFDR
ncbi:hypothetical protein RJ639_018883 [Escallonia herrerae]|uniref:Uncharacterized protein n=1 Tax=Escallonia herrerae TaxID=1293975 RepID=A0AA89AJ98_9ASTE|nr:hypothetical protein RJ639_018883 [Escallonia herrerae]